MSDRPGVFVDFRYADDDEEDETMSDPLTIETITPLTEAQAEDAASLTAELDANDAAECAAYRFTVAGTNPSVGHAVICPSIDGVGVEWGGDPQWFHLPDETTDEAAIVERALNAELPEL